MQYLYHCKNNGKKITLITRNKNIYENLKKYFICEELFDTIISVGSGKKSDYIFPNSIFIDDSYQERIDVYSICGCNVFNCDMIEALFDEKL
jgi:hypothetical protein